LPLLFIKKKHRFFSTNRDNKDDQIYQAKPICALDLLATVTNGKTGLVLTQAKVALLDEKKNIVATEMSNEKGEVNFRVACEQSYTLQVSKDGFEGNTFAVAKVIKPTQTKIDTPLQPIDVIVTEKEVVLNSIFLNTKK